MNPHTGGNADSTNPWTWATFDEAFAFYMRGEADGIGFVLTDDDDGVGIDLDHCVEGGEIAPWAKAEIERHGSYAEYSPSGTGIRIIARGKLPPGGRKRGNVEIYESARYLTLTGHRVPDAPATIEHRQAEIEAFHAQHFPARSPVSFATTTTSSMLGDLEVLERAFGAANGAKVRALYGGDDSLHGGDTSAADLALLSSLAFWTQGRAQLDRLFRGSRRMREKWDERHASDGRTYGEMTIGVVLSSVRETYGSRPAETPTRTPGNGASETTTPARDRALPGGDAILDVPAAVPAVWGVDDQVLWAEGESLLVVGGDGTGKTSLAGALTLAGLGLRDPVVLGLPVAVFSGRLLYLALDRPAQIRRAFRRAVTEADREALNAGLTIWAGPLPFDITTGPHALLPFVRDHGACVVVVDSLKDAVLDISSDLGGQAWNLARQDLLADGIQLLELHHPRKVTAMKATGPQSAISAVHGSRWISAGAGSVILLEADPGDPVVKLRHLKQPAAEVVGVEIAFDQDLGTVGISERPDPLGYMRSCSNGTTAAQLAAFMFDKDSPSKAENAKALRQLRALVRQGSAHEEPGTGGGARAGSLTRWHAMTNRAEDDGHGTGTGRRSQPVADGHGSLNALTGTATGTVRARVGTGGERQPVETGTATGTGERGTNGHDSASLSRESGSPVANGEVRTWRA